MNEEIINQPPQPLQPQPNLTNNGQQEAEPRKKGTLPPPISPLILIIMLLLVFTFITVAVVFIFQMKITKINPEELNPLPTIPVHVVASPTPAPTIDPLALPTINQDNNLETIDKEIQETEVSSPEADFNDLEIDAAGL